MPHKFRIIAIALALCFSGCSKREEVSFYFCHRVILTGYFEAGSSVPDLNTYLKILQSDTIWKEAAPLIGGKIRDAQKFRASISFSRGAYDRTSESHRLVVVASGAGASQDDVKFALGVMVDALGRYIASHQPHLSRIEVKPASNEVVSYDKITGSTEKLYRYIER